MQIEIHRPMIKKLHITIITIVATVSVATAAYMMGFTSWDKLTKESPDIVIARCPTTPDPMGIADGMVWSDIEVVSVLKGETKPGSARMFSQHWPYQNEYFLMFATYQSNQTYQAYCAAERYRIVPLGHLFRVITNEIAGKPLNEQIQLVLQRRLEDLNQELKQNEAEEKRLKEGLKK